MVVCGYEERDCEVLRVVDPKRFFLSVDDDTEFRSRCECRTSRDYYYDELSMSATLVVMS